MKLMFDLPQADEAALPPSAAQEKRMYCLPFNYENNEYTEGYMLFTDKHIYKLLDGKLLCTYDYTEMSDYSIETLYGCSAFYAKINGISTMLCRINSGRNLPRYAVMVKACELLSKGDSEKSLTSEEPERFCPKCGRPFVVHTKICPFCQDKKEIYKKLWGMTRGLRLMMLAPLLTTAIAVIIRFVVPFFQAIAIDQYIIPHNRQYGAFIAVIFAIVSFDFLHRVISVVQTRISAVSGNKFTLVLRSLLFEKIQMLSMSSIQEKSTGDLMGRINNDVSVVQNFITNLLPSYMSYLLSFIVALCVMIWLNPLMCLFIFIPLPIAIFFVAKFRKTMNRRNVRSWVLGMRANHQLQDVLSGIRIVKSYGNEEAAVTEFEKNTGNQAKQDCSNAKLFDTVFPIIGFVIRLGSYAILMYGNYIMFMDPLTIGLVNQCNTYCTMIYEPIMQITSIPRSISEFTTSLSKVLEILEENPDVSDIDNPEYIKVEGNISVQNVTFGYNSYDPVLKNISLDIKAGEMIGIVGHSGCGKTTLVNLIMRLYDATEGRILIDGIDIKTIAQNSLRTQMGVVLQETLLFSGSIRDNIRYAAPFATNEQVIEAAKLANAHDFIMSLPEGYNTIVGEKGYSLSGGERQRIAIARALIHNPKILILDEATAALDTETEKLIQDAINHLTEGRTTIAIAHRLSTLRNADKILVIDHGKLKEYGTHRELLDMKGIYYKLVMAQQRLALEK